MVLFVVPEDETSWNVTPGVSTHFFLCPSSKNNKVHFFVGRLISFAAKQDEPFESKV